MTHAAYAVRFSTQLQAFNKHWVQVQKFVLVLEIVPLLKMRMTSVASPWNCQHSNLAQSSEVFHFFFLVYFMGALSSYKSNGFCTFYVFCIASSAQTCNSVLPFMSQPCFIWSKWNFAIDSSKAGAHWNQYIITEIITKMQRNNRETNC